MRYWVYINDKVDGPFEEMKLADVAGFTPDTLICAEDANGGNQEWVKASSIFEFDEATKTMTRTNMTEEDYQKLTGQAPAQETAEQEQATVQSGNIDNEATRILIEKIDHLTHEIEGMKGKLDEAIAAAAEAQAEMTKHNLAIAAAAKAAEEKAAQEKEAAEAQTPVQEEVKEQPAEEPQAQEDTLSLSATDDSVTDDALITNTASLVNHAEQLVAQSSEENLEEPIDFLDEIQIDAAQEDGYSEKEGEEVVLRSALDSLYSASQIQTEEEKETTFQDLLSPIKTAAVATAAVGTAAVVAASSSDENKEETPAEEPAAQPVEEQVTEEPATQPVEEQVTEEPATQPVEEQVTEEPAVEPITEEQREELINEITASSQQNDFIAQALAEAQQQENSVAEETPVQEEPAAELQEIAPSQEEPTSTEEFVQDSSQEKESLDLSNTPQLTINDVGIEEISAQPEEPLPVAQPSEEIDASLTPMGPEETQEASQEITETVKELVPGKKLEDTLSEGDGILSQADLEEAFTERAPLQEDFPLPEDNPSQEEEQPAEQAVPSHAGEMTEVELKEGSTYLISDFIPPAQANAEVKVETKEDNNIEELAPAAAVGTAAAVATVAAAIPDTITKNESVEDITPIKDEADLTMSKVILENTIKTKRGATMDIKTVPMVKEPADAHRLDLSDSELADINAQHDLKAADLKPTSNNLTKIILGTLVSVVIAAIIYVMLAYLEILPAQFNFLKKGATAELIKAEQAQLNEMLGAPADPLQQLPQDSFGATQPLQLPEDVQTVLDPQAVAPVNPLDHVLNEVKNYTLSNGQTLQQLINAKHPAMQEMIEWNITTAVEPQNYSILVKVPPENPQSFKISYRFNYNTENKALDPTISDSKNLLDSVNAAR